MGEFWKIFPANLQITAFNTCGTRSNRWRRQTTAGPQSHTMAMAGSATFRPLDVAGIGISGDFYLGSKLYCVGPSSYFREPKNLVMRLKGPPLHICQTLWANFVKFTKDFFHSRKLPPARKHFNGCWSDVAPLNLDSITSVMDGQCSSKNSWWLTALLQVGFSQIKRQWLQDSAVPKALSALMWKSFGEPQTKDILFIRLRRREQMEQGKLVVEDLVISYQIFTYRPYHKCFFNVYLCLWFFSSFYYLILYFGPLFFQRMIFHYGLYCIDFLIFHFQHFVHFMVFYLRWRWR